MGWLRCQSVHLLGRAWEIVAANQRRCGDAASAYRVARMPDHWSLGCQAADTLTIKGKTMDTPSAKYGIPAAKRPSKVKPKTSISACSTNATAMAAAKKVMTEHRTVIK